MKIRIQHNNFRIRLNDREVENLHQGNELASVTSFPENNLTISLKTDRENSARLRASQIIIGVAQEQVKQWASSDDVTIALEFAVANDEKLSILVEKDMKM